MHLKSLTLRGFKSFASATTLHLEPGITCVVGPNGSGKSNVVDALAWVMGEQGPKSLRGGKMEDVIFAGTTDRPPLGRAEVVLTIDNSDRALPVDYGEVTISRTMFRHGGSEYAINGQSCRLLDVQELLSDSGIGREMHVVVGQGQLDAILYASPEERRGFIEEAAGVLKHRKRKEKAQRKVAATDGNLTRLQDVLGEIRRQLKPLGRQADMARRAAEVQSEARDVRARLLAGDLVTAQDALAAELADEAALRRRRDEGEAEAIAVRHQETELEELQSALAPQVLRAHETWHQLSALRERIGGTAALAAERARLSTTALEETPTGREPQELEAEAGLVAEQESQLRTQTIAQEAALSYAVAARVAAESARADEQHRVTRVDACRSRISAVEEELARMLQARDEAVRRAARAEHDYTALETRVAGLDAGERGLDEEYDAALSVLTDVEAQLAKLRDEVQRAERERAELAARKEALELGLVHRDGAQALLAVSDRHNGLLGSTAAVLSVRPGYEAAVAAALAGLAESVAVADLDTATAVITQLRVDDMGRAPLLVGGGPDDGEPWPLLPTGAQYAVDVVSGPAVISTAVRAALRRVAVVPDLSAARSLLRQSPTVVAVTMDGDVLGAHSAVGGSAGAPSLLAAQRAYEDTTEALTTATSGTERMRFALLRLDQERSEAQTRVDVALARLHESDAAMAAVAEQLGSLSSTAHSARAEAERVNSAIEAAQAGLGQHTRTLAELEAGSREAEDIPATDLDTASPDTLALAATEARQAETDARLDLRTLEERARALAGRASALRDTARAEREARTRTLARREQRQREGEAAGAVMSAATLVMSRLEESLQLACASRDTVVERHASGQTRLEHVRMRLRDLAAEADRLTQSVHRDEMARAEKRLRIAQLEQRAADELGLDLEALITGYGPNTPASAQYDREQQVVRLRSAERALAQLGAINPLALEEYHALEERHAFLTAQLDDLRRTRRDLLDIVSDVDAQVEEVVTAAWQDTAREFSDVFARLFPGGEGRLVLSDPSDILATGIEVDAKPLGKKLKRLSLLSGGERSLVAVAFLIALFKARPSPFYILDEVEAALDDTNLGRLLTIYDELRATSQLVVITHQKRTMEIADALYGVSMRGDGVSTVISQRLRTTEPA